MVGDLGKSSTEPLDAPAPEIFGLSLDPSRESPRAQTGTVPDRPRLGAARRRSRALAPLAVPLLALALMALTGLTQRSLFGTALEDRFYGFFFDRYPLFVFAILYGLARIAVAWGEPGGRWWLRWLTGPAGLFLFLALCLHPTFGGLVLRPGYMTGGMAFLTNQPLGLAVGLGATASALVYGLALGAAEALARGRLRWGWRPLAGAAVSFLALWWGALVIGAPRSLGFDGLGGWPSLPLDARSALFAAGLILAAALPHGLWAARRKP